MNSSTLGKLAFAFRLMAEAIDELAVADQPKPRKRAAYRTPRRPTQPTEAELTNVTDVTRARAERVLRKRGIIG